MISLRRNEAPLVSLGRRSDVSRGRHERLPSIDDVDDDGASNSRSPSTEASGTANANLETGVFETNPAIADETTELTSNSVITSPDHSAFPEAIAGLNSNSNSNLNSNPRGIIPTTTPVSSGTENSAFIVNDAQAQNTEDSEAQARAASMRLSLSEDGISPPETDNLQSRLQSQLQHLSDQSEVYKHTTQTWTVIITLILMRIWLEALISADIGLTSISLICTSYFLRWRQYRQLQVQRFDERIEFLTQLSNHEDDDNLNASASRESGGIDVDDDDDEEVGLSGSGRRSRRWRSRLDHQRRNRNRLRMDFAREDHVDFEMLSFQAQLALALMESQQMMQNGVNNENRDENANRGVSEEKKLKWNTFEYSTEEDFNQFVEKNVKWKNDSQNDHYVKGIDNGDDEAPSCCICLCEYEGGDKMVQLPCGHVFHSDCIDSWTQNHSTCPLCNSELDEENNPPHNST